MTLNSASGLISGTPSLGSAGAYSFTVDAADSLGAQTSQAFTLVINPAVSLGALSFGQWTANRAGFIGAIPVSTGTGAATLTVNSGRLPVGMKATLSGGIITFAGKPTVAGTYNFTLKLIDHIGATASQSYTIVIRPATNFVWTGGGGANETWSDPANWSGAAPAAGDVLIFGPGATQKSANNDFLRVVAAIAFQDSGYTIMGNAIKLTNNLSIGSTSMAGGTDTLGLNIALTTSEEFNIAGTTLIDVTGTISGPALGIAKFGSGTLAYDGATGNTYTGTTTISGGTLKLNRDNQIVAAGRVTVNAGATFNLNGHNQTIGSLILNAGAVNTEAGTLSLGGNIFTAAAGTSATINGNLNLGAATRTITVANGMAANDLVIAAVISGAAGVGITKAGAGTLILTGVNTYTGITAVAAGVLGGSGTVLGAP